MLTATTSKSAPPSLACRASSAGISLRQGTHQVAHRFSSTVRPRQSASDFAAAAAVREGEVGQALRASSATATAATSPRASGASRSAQFRPPAWQAGSAAALPAGGQSRIPPPARPRRRPRRPSSDQGEPLAGVAAGVVRLMSVNPVARSVMSGEARHEQQDVGRALRVAVPPPSWRRSTPRSTSTGTCTARTSPPARPMPRCWPNRASSRRTMPRKIAHGLDTILSEIERRQVHASSARSKTSI